MYGETEAKNQHGKHLVGLSPHVRGNRRERFPHREGAGSIPHVRGNLLAQLGPGGGEGSIPACTGKPYPLPDSADEGGVYPRMYGETADRYKEPYERKGLSPHVRGNRVALAAPAVHRGSIPACTGKPDYHPALQSPSEVYPRMYGETVGWDGSCREKKGLSPHVRGNPPSISSCVGGRRSIPACTGKPRTNRAVHPIRTVYPRMYGETAYTVTVINPTRGLSPHVRGNLRYVVVGKRHYGSIPACTGKPMIGSQSRSSIRVYPRMYGETQRNRVLRTRAKGLSPHVRGNRSDVTPPPAVVRSIPACTGKPAVVPRTTPGGRVYPRMYGETLSAASPIHTTVGLSPHVRGNRVGAAAGVGAAGSIPACTGKP